MTALPWVITEIRVEMVSMFVPCSRAGGSACRGPAAEVLVRGAAAAAGLGRGSELASADARAGIVTCSAEESGGRLMIEVADQGVAEPPAGGGRVRLGREHIKADAGQVPGIPVGDGGVGVEEGAAGNVDEPGAGTHGPEHGVVDERRLAGLMAGRDDD